MSLIIGFVFEILENIVRKGEHAGNQHFLFSQNIFKSFFAKGGKNTRFFVDETAGFSPLFAVNQKTVHSGLSNHQRDTKNKLSLRFVWLCTDSIENSS